MPKYEIRYSGNGRAYDQEWETIEAKSLDEASLEAWQRARDDFEGYAWGYIDDDELQGLDDEEKAQVWHDVAESIIDYEAREYRLD